MKPAAPGFALNPHAAPHVRAIGDEREPLLQIDRLLAAPEALVDYAVREGGFEPAYGPSGGYPGIRAPAPLDYVEGVVRAVDPLLREVFGLARVRLGRAECNLSLATLAPHALVPTQREPHVDTSDPLQFAFLHYLCANGFGGTAFYRHRRTGFETLTPDRIRAYEKARKEERAKEPSRGYFGASTSCFMQIASIDAAFNRLIVYRSHLLHSGLIGSDALSPDPRRGRLTANIFLTYRRA